MSKNGKCERPDVAYELRQWCRDLMTENSKDQTRVEPVELVSKYAFDKPIQRIDTNGTEVIKLSDLLGDD